MRKIKVATVQMDSQHDKASNLQKAERLIREAAGQGAQYVALPEYFNFVGTEEQEEANAEYIPDGETVQFLSRLSKELNIWLHGGSMLEKVRGEVKFYNATVLFNPQGELVGKYRKIHLFDVEIESGPSYLESQTKDFGREVVVCDTDFAKIGLAICYDIRFPELFRLQSLKGAEILMLPAEFTLYTGRDHWETLLRARAIENQAYVIAPGQIGKKPSYQSYGRSMIVDPWGTVIATAADAEMVTVAEIDLDYVQQIRKQVPSLKNRRPEVYSLHLS
ncbi:carbon-nitrogen hydrolase family protein [Paenibacillus validus]|uniref:carbon-nitrogen hydrolase family protein n=1 Tax=Paenibacillus TaxID=44249 RepID=UPI0006D1643E|nr:MULTISPECIES: carbon-nitrogen hydrolase family protein [Paenibacillus]MED4600480.1 carbon-nitrogen hydrolase family protein [Paenibacillus validus]MED4604739.1 carbon-nitrogen hydrolase family protein [Paenibacillus validus]